MKMPIKLFLLGILSVHFIALASELSTKWTIKNNAKEAITLSCKNISEQGSNIAMTTKSIKPGGFVNFDWGDNYYNDGLWLNPGNWKCNTKNKTKLTEKFENFSTDWGESITLVVNAVDNKMLKLTKAEKKDSSLAIKNQNKKDSSIE